MHATDNSNKLIAINPSLNKKAKFFGILPISQIGPLAAIAFFSFLLVGAAGGKDKQFAGLFGFMSLTWLAATGTHPHYMTDRMRPFPGKNWGYVKLPYVSPIPENRPEAVRSCIADSEVKLVAKPTIEMNQDGKKEIYTPFKNYQHLEALVQYCPGGKDIGALFLQHQQQYQLVFCFELIPWHSSFTPEQARKYCQLVESSLKTLLPGESFTFYCQKYADDTSRTAQLSSVIDNCQSKGIKILTESNLGNTKSLTKKGYRQNFSYLITCTYSFTKDGDVGTDFVSRTIRTANQLLGLVAGDKKQLTQNFREKSLESAYRNGFLIWQTTLKTANRLDIKPLTIEQTWQHLWWQFNPRHVAVPQVPNYWTWDGKELGEVVNKPVHPLSILSAGVGANYAVPQHNRRHDEIVLPAKKQVCGVMTIEEITNRQLYPIEQLQFVLDIMQDDDVGDTEFVIQLNPVSSSALDQQLETIIAQASSANNTAKESAIGRDVKSEQILEQAFEAQRLVGGGGAGVYLSFVAKVYRPNRTALTQACNELERKFDGTLKRQDSAVWALWLETLPISIGRILQKTSIVEDRRIKLDNYSYYRYLPNLSPESVHQDGFELVVKGGKPIYIDMHREDTLRGLIIGESGSGKSVLAWRIMLDFLSNNIPVIGMDSAVGGNSSFRWAIKMLGGAHIDISRNSSNLLEPPDLRTYRGDDYKVRLSQWRTTVRHTLTTYIMFGVEDAKLKQRVEAFVARTTNRFVRDNKIRKRINAAFEAGFGTPQWQQMPVLADWLKFCTKEKLNLKDFEELDRQAINQIRTQIDNLLGSALGDTIGRPSTFDPKSQIKFFTIVNLNSERDQVLIAQTIQSTCVRLAAQYHKSLIVGDEIADLLKKGGFADTWGAMHAMARKSGISLLTISQNIEEIQKCSAAADILKNISFKLIGRITTDGATSLVDSLKYPDLVYENSTKAFNTNKVRGCSYWLLEMQNQFWQTQFFPSDINLAIVANGKNEIAIREKIMARAIERGTSRWLALKEYAMAITSKSSNNN